MQFVNQMKFLKLRLPSTGLVFAAILALLPAPQARAEQTNNDEVRAHFPLCDLATVKVRDENNKVPFFVDSYAVRALCAAYDMTGNTNYLDACRDWSERMVKYQKQMTPRGAYYMHYNRKPGETTNDWYAADSSSIGMAVLATAVRCHGAEQKRLLNSAKKFANLVIKNYVKPSGGVSDGLWHESSDEWWCSSGIFGSFLFNLYASTGDQHYLRTALRATDWLNGWDLTKPQPFPLSQQGPTMIFYVMENYSAGWPYISQDEARKKAALAKVRLVPRLDRGAAAQAGRRPPMAADERLGHEIRRPAVPPICLRALSCQRKIGRRRRRGNAAARAADFCRRPADVETIDAHHPASKFLADVLRRVDGAGRDLSKQPVKSLAGIQAGLFYRQPPKSARLRQTIFTMTLPFSRRLCPLAAILLLALFRARATDYWAAPAATGTGDGSSSANAAYYLIRLSGAPFRAAFPRLTSTSTS